MVQEKKSTAALRIASGLAMLFVSFCFFGVLFLGNSAHPNVNLADLLIPLSIFMPFGLICLFMAWRFLRDGLHSESATLLPKWFFWCFGIFISILIGIAGYFHPVSIIPVVVAILFTVISYKYRKQ
jgi:hypothetical protein